MASGDEWSRLARRARADQLAAQRRGNGRGRAQPDRPGMIRAVTTRPPPDRQPTGPAASTTDTTKETTMPDSPAYLAAMHAKANEHLGRALYETTKAVFDADGFRWRDHDTQTAIAARFRDLRDDTAITAAITAVICATYADHGHPHDPAAVRRAVTRQLDGAGPHGDQPGAQTSW
jgi:hypothetical protein